MSSEITLSYSHGASAVPLLGETIGASLRRVAAAHPEAEVLVDVPTGRRWTYAAFDAETDTLARGLIAAGWRPAAGSGSGRPSIEDVQVIGVPDVKYGEELCAWIRVRPGAELDADQVREYCRGKIAHYKVPRYVRFTADFPMTITGKVQKYKMRETSVAELGLGDAGNGRTA